MMKKSHYILMHGVILPAFTVMLITRTIWPKVKKNEVYINPITMVILALAIVVGYRFFVAWFEILPFCDFHDVHVCLSQPCMSNRGVYYGWKKVGCDDLDACMDIIQDHCVPDRADDPECSKAIRAYLSQQHPCQNASKN